MGAGLLRQDKFAEAEPPLRESLAILAKQMPNHRQHDLGQSYLGAALASQRRFAEAEPLLLAGYEGLAARKALPAPHQGQLIQAVDRLIRLYEAWDKPGQAAPWRVKRDQMKAAAEKPLGK